MIMTGRRREYPSGKRTINSLNILMWIIFLLVYANARYLFHSFDLTGFHFYIKATYHFGFYVPLGMFLWRREFSIVNVSILLVLLSCTPEVYQNYYHSHLWVESFLDAGLNFAGGIIGILCGMLWTVKDLTTK